MIKPGMIVRYASGWYEPGEEIYRFVVLENRMSPITGQMSRWLIRAVNTALSIPPTEVVEEYMIEPAEKTF